MEAPLRGLPLQFSDQVIEKTNWVLGGAAGPRFPFIPLLTHASELAISVRMGQLSKRCLSTKWGLYGSERD